MDRVFSILEKVNVCSKFTICSHVSKQLLSRRLFSHVVLFQYFRNKMEYIFWALTMDEKSAFATVERNLHFFRWASSVNHIPVWFQELGCAIQWLRETFSVYQFNQDISTVKAGELSRAVQCMRWLYFLFISFIYAEEKRKSKQFIRIPKRKPKLRTWNLLHKFHFHASEYASIDETMRDWCVYQRS